MRRSRLNHLLVVADAILAVVRIPVRHAAGIARLNRVDTPFLIEGERSVDCSFIFGHIAAGLVVEPEGDTEAVGVGLDPREVEIGIRTRVVEMFLASPSVPSVVPAFKQDALDVVGRGKIYVPQRILRRGAVTGPHRPALGPEVHTPPDSYVFLRLNPRGVLYLRGLVEIEYQG